MRTTVTFAGNLVEDPQIQFTTNGTPVASLRVLVNRRIQDTAGEWTDAQPTAHNCKAFGQTGENIVESLVKGDRVLVHGEVRTETWDDRDTAEKRYKDIVIIDEIGPSLKWATTNQIHRNTHHQLDTDQD